MTAPRELTKEQIEQWRSRLVWDYAAETSAEDACQDELNALCDLALSALASQAKGAEAWISVNERLPAKEHQFHLVYTELSLCTFTAYLEGGLWYHACGSSTPQYQVRQVTHWRSLPTPPEQREQGQEQEFALNVGHKDCHKAADAFWQYWRENGQTHKHGYFESTWGAINQAIRYVGVKPHTYGKPKIEVTGTTMLGEIDNMMPSAPAEQSAVMVPREPTGAMLDAGTKAVPLGRERQLANVQAEACYKAMLAAAPSPAPSAGLAEPLLVRIAECGAPTWESLPESQRGKLSPASAYSLGSAAAILACVQEVQRG